MKAKLLAFLTLFTSLSTLLCCALPALFVALGMGAAFAGLVTKFPQMIWISEHKTLVFGLGALFLIFGGASQMWSRQMDCPVDAKLAEACRVTRRRSAVLYFASLGIYAVGAFFAFALN